MRAFLLVGLGRACNPYDYNPESHYDRPMAFMVDTNFIDFGKASPPYVPPIPYGTINLYPNPAIDNVTLQITDTKGIYNIYNSCGKLISSGILQASTDIAIHNLAQGIYIIHIKTPQGNNIGSVKFVKRD